MDLFNLYASLTLDTSNYNKQVESAKKSGQDLGDALGDVGGEAKKAGTQFDGAGSSTKEFASQMQKAVTVGNLMASALKSLANQALNVGKSLVSSGISYNAQMEQYQVALTTLLGSAEEANTALENIKKDAARTPFDTAGLISANRMLISTGESAEDSRKVINALGDAVSAVGGGNDELSRMAQNLQQIKNAGKATSMDIKQFAYAGIDVYSLLADYTGKTTAEVQEMTVTYDLLTNALIKASSEGGKFYGAMDEQSQTFNGRLETLKDNFEQFVGLITEGLTDKAGDFLDIAASWVDTLTTAFKENGVAGMLEAGADIVLDLGQSIADNAYTVGERAADIISSLTNGIAERLPDILSTAADIVTNFVGGIADHFPEIVSSGIELLTNLVTGIVDNFPKLIEAAGEAVVKFGAAILENLPTILDAGVQILESLVEGIANTVESLKNIAITCIDSFISSIESNVDALKNSGSLLGQALGSVLDSTVVSWLNTISEKVHEWAKGINDTITAGNALSAAGVKVSSGGITGGVKTAASIYAANKKGQAQTEYYKNQQAKAAQKAAEKAANKAVQDEANAARWQAQTEYWQNKLASSTPDIDTGGGKSTGTSSKKSSSKKTAEKELTDAEKLANALEKLGDGYTYTTNASTLAADKLAYYEGEVTSAQEKVDKLTYLFEQATAGTNETGLSTEQLGEELLKAESALDSAKDALEEYKDETDEAKLATKQLKSAVSDLSGSLGGIGSTISKLGDSLGLSGLSNLGDFISGIGDGIDTVTSFAENIDTLTNSLNTLSSMFSAAKSSGSGLGSILSSLLGSAGSAVASTTTTTGGTSIVATLTSSASGLASAASAAASALGPVGLVVAATGLIAAFKVASAEGETFAEKLKNAWKSSTLGQTVSSLTNSNLSLGQKVADVFLNYTPVGWLAKAFGVKTNQQKYEEKLAEQQAEEEAAAQEAAAQEAASAKKLYSNTRAGVTISDVKLYDENDMVNRATSSAFGALSKAVSNSANIFKQLKDTIDKRTQTYDIDINIDGAQYDDDEKLAKKISVELLNLKRKKESVFA